jgi:hypothetical protein
MLYFARKRYGMSLSKGKVDNGQYPGFEPMNFR